MGHINCLGSYSLLFIISCFLSHFNLKGLVLTYLAIYVDSNAGMGLKWQCQYCTSYNIYRAELAAKITISVLL